MDMEMSKAEALKRLELQISIHGDTGRLILPMFLYFYSRGALNGPLEMVVDSWVLFRELRCAERSGAFDAKTCEDLKNWFCKVRDEGNMLRCYEDFKTLMRSRDFMLLCYWLYPEKPSRIALRSSNGMVFYTDKSVAAAESLLLDDVFRETSPVGEAIPLYNVPSAILSKVIHFWEKKHDVFKKLESITSSYKFWLTDFMNSNMAILPDLHEAATYLQIPSLSDLTTNMFGKTVEEISEWYGNLSLSQMLSSLGFEVGIGVGKDVHHRDGGNAWGSA